MEFVRELLSFRNCLKSRWFSFPEAGFERQSLKLIAGFAQNRASGKLFRLRQLIAQKVSFYRDLKLLIWSVLGLGVILRLAQFLPNRSLWLDEARLALNIVNRSFGQLLQPLDYVQGAPPGFLMIEKLAVEAFGNNEYTLRLFPLLAGIISMLLFYKVASEYLAHNRAVLIACGFFILSTHLIYYSAEVKQYSSDVAVSLALYAITAYLLHTQELTVLRLALLGVAGAAAPWFSHPAVFVLAGIAITLTFSTARRKEWAGIAQLLVVFLLWGVSFMALYVLSLRNLAATAGLLDYWAGSFAPFPPSSVADVKWWVGTFFAIFTYPVGLTFPGLAALAFLVGGVELLKKQLEKLLLLASPILLTLLASGWHKYPFEGRFLLFIVPAVLLIMVAGLEQISSLTHASTPLIGATFTGLLFLHPILSVMSKLTSRLAMCCIFTMGPKMPSSIIKPGMVIRIMTISLG